MTQILCPEVTGRWPTDDHATCTLCSAKGPAISFTLGPHIDSQRESGSFSLDSLYHHFLQVLLKVGILPTPNHSSREYVSSLLHAKFLHEQNVELHLILQIHVVRVSHVSTYVSVQNMYIHTCMCILVYMGESSRLQNYFICYITLKSESYWLRIYENKTPNSIHASKMWSQETLQWWHIGFELHIQVGSIGDSDTRKISMIMFNWRKMPSQWHKGSLELDHSSTFQFSCSRFYCHVIWIHQKCHSKW